jgi:hypothetical protein
MSGITVYPAVNPPPPCGRGSCAGCGGGCYNPPVPHCCPVPLGSVPPLAWMPVVGCPEPVVVGAGTENGQSELLLIGVSYSINADGSLSIVVSGVNGVGMLEYSIDGVNWQSSPTFTFPPGQTGPVLVLVRDSAFPGHVTGLWVYPDKLLVGITDGFLPGPATNTCLAGQQRIVGLRYELAGQPCGNGTLQIIGKRFFS